MNISEAIRTFLSSEPIFLGLVPPNVADDFPLIDSGALDSIGIFDLVAFLEKTFSITVEPQDLNEANFRSIESIRKYVQAQQK